MIGLARRDQSIDGEPLGVREASWFIGPDIHSPIHLAGIRRQNFCTENFGDLNPDTAFPDSRWANDRDDGFQCVNQFGIVHQ